MIRLYPSTNYQPTETSDAMLEFGKHFGTRRKPGNPAAFRFNTGQIMDPRIVWCTLMRILASIMGFCGGGLTRRLGSSFILFLGTIRSAVVSSVPETTRHSHVIPALQSKQVDM